MRVTILVELALILNRNILCNQFCSESLNIVGTKTGALTGYTYYFKGASM